MRSGKESTLTYTHTHKIYKYIYNDIVINKHTETIYVWILEICMDLKMIQTATTKEMQRKSWIKLAKKNQV